MCSFCENVCINIYYSFSRMIILVVLFGTPTAITGSILYGIYQMADEQGFDVLMGIFAFSTGFYLALAANWMRYRGCHLCEKIVSDEELICGKKYEDMNDHYSACNMHDVTVWDLDAFLRDTHQAQFSSFSEYCCHTCCSEHMGRRAIYKNEDFLRWYALNKQNHFQDIQLSQPMGNSEQSMVVGRNNSQV